jgi:uncharacterized membrane protein YjfL (UPF0719 family)
MNSNALYLGIIEMALGLIYGILLCFVVFWVMRKLFLNKMDVKFDNLAFGILLGFVLFSTGEMVSSALQPAIDFTHRLMNMNLMLSEMVIKASYTISGFFVASTIVACIIIILSFTLFSWLTTGLNEYEEIKNKNIAVAIITGTIILVITKFVAGGLEMVFEAFIPYPEMPRIF